MFGMCILELSTVFSEINCDILQTSQMNIGYCVFIFMTLANISVFFLVTSNDLSFSICLFETSAP